MRCKNVFVALTVIVACGLSACTVKASQKEDVPKIEVETAEPLVIETEEKPIDMNEDINRVSVYDTDGNVIYECITLEKEVNVSWQDNELEVTVPAIGCRCFEEDEEDE